MFVLDADAHVEESAATFRDDYLEPAYRARRPQEIALGDRAVWLIDDRLFPQTVGHGAYLFACPPGVEGQPSRLTAMKRDAYGSITLDDVDQRLQAMDSERLDVQVIYPTIFLAYPLTDDVGFATALHRAYNRWVADVCGQRPERLRWVCAVNLDDVPGAIAEIRRCRRETNAVGVVIFGTAGDHKLDDPVFEPFWDAACDLNLPVAAHIGWSSPSLGRIYDTAYDAITGPMVFTLFTGFVDLLAGGVLDRHPTLKVTFLEAGCEWLPFLLRRMQHVYELAVGRGRIPYAAREEPLEYLRRGNVYLPFEADDKLLPYCMDQFGADRFLFASDMPHGDRDFTAVDDLLARPDLPEAARPLLLGENARRFYGL